MAIEVQAPGGVVISFPDGTDAATIQKVMASNFGGPQQQGPEVSKLESAGRGALQGLTMGFSDELYGGAMGIKEALTGSGTFRQGYDKSIEEVRAANKQAQAANPWIYGLGEVAGGVAVPGGLARMGVRGALARTAGQGMGARMLAGAREGAAYGAVAGAGHGEGGIAERAPSAALGAGLGAAVGAVAPPLVDAGAAVARSVATPIRAAMQPRQVAREKVAESLMRDVGQQLTPFDAMSRVSRRLAADPGMMLADAGGENTRNLLRAAANQASAGAQRLNRSLDVRQAGQWHRISNYVENVLGGQRFGQHQATRAAQQAAQANTAYGQAYAVPFADDAQREITQFIANRPYMQRLFDLTQQNVQGMRGTQSNLNPWEMLHRTRMQIDRQMRQLRRGQPDPVANWTTNDLAQLRREFTALMERHNGQFGAANRQFADHETIMRAADEGREIFKNAPIEDLAQAMARHAQEGPAVASAFRLGAGRSLIGDLMRGNKLRDRTENIFSSPDMEQRLQVLFPTQRQLREFQRRLIIEAKKADTRKAVQGNSTTAKQLMQSEEAGQPMRAAVATAQAATGRLEPFLSYVGRQAQRFSGITPAVANEIINAGMTKNRVPMSSGLMAAMEGAAMAPARRARTARGITYGTLGGFIGGQ